MIKKVCRSCGGDNVGSVAAVRWNVESQEWDISVIFKEEWCDDCEGETRLIDKEI